MTFYQELQLNQAQSKAVIRNATGKKEKLHHIYIYLCKIAITMIFCMCFVMLSGTLLGNDNSIVGVVVLLFLMVFKNADFGINSSHSLWVIGMIFGILIVGPQAANEAGAFGGLLINSGCIFLLAVLSCHNIMMFNHSTVILGYLLLYGYTVSGEAFTARIIGLICGAVLTMIVFYRGHRNRFYKRTLHSFVKEFDIHSSRTKWQISLTLGISSVMFWAEAFHFPRSMWAGIAVMSVMLPFEKDSKTRSKGRIPGNLFGAILFFLLYGVLSSDFLDYAGIIGGIGVGLSVSYGWQSVFNSFGAMAVATGLFGLKGAIFLRIFHNVCGSLYGQMFYRMFHRLIAYFMPEDKRATV